MHLDDKQVKLNNWLSQCDTLELINSGVLYKMRNFPFPGYGGLIRSMSAKKVPKKAAKLNTILLAGQADLRPIKIDFSN